MSDKKKNPRGVFERRPGSGVWYARYEDSDGKIHRERVGPKSLAEKVYMKRKTEIAEGRFYPTKQHTFGNLVDDAVKFLEDRHKQRYGDEPCKLGRFEIVKEWFGDMRASSLTPSDISAKLAEECQTPATRNRYRAVFSRVFSLAIKNGKATRNPARGVDLLKENNGRTRCLADDEETRLRKAIRKLCPDREAELDLALHSGMRWSEQYELTWDRVDLKHGQLTVDCSKHGERRYVELNDAAIAALKRLRVLHPDSALVCPDGYDHREWWDAVRTEAKFPMEKKHQNYFRWHDLRHCFATRLVRRGVTLFQIKELLGHKTLAMTARYSHLERAQLRQAVQQLVQPGDHSTDHLTLDAQTPTSQTIN